MSEQPILFSGEMVRAILDGRKTQTRRVIKPQPCHIGGSDEFGRFATDDGQGTVANFTGYAKCPYGKPGDRLWVREAAYIAPPNFGRESDTNLTDDQGRGRVVSWAASSESPEAAGWYGIKKTPSIHMPRWASRITLEVVAVRVQRVQAISRDDVQAEGIESKAWDSGLRKEAFASLWDKINGKRAPWASNPWVWVVEFKPVAGGVK